MIKNTTQLKKRIHFFGVDIDSLNMSETVNEIKKWLNETLKAKEENKDASIGVDDLTRHDKWLCMMYPRLQLLQRLLSNDGEIFISISFPLY